MKLADMKDSHKISAFFNYGQIGIFTLEGFLAFSAEISHS